MCNRLCRLQDRRDDPLERAGLPNDHVSTDDVNELRGLFQVHGGDSSTCNPVVLP